MKKVLMVVAVACSATLGFAAEWVQIGESSVYYDAASLDSGRFSGDVLAVDAWVKFFGNSKTYPYEVEVTSMHAYYRCASTRTYQTIQWVKHDKFGNVLASETEAPSHDRWQSVVPDTVADVASKRLCRIAYERHMLPKAQAPKPNASPTKPKPSLTRPKTQPRAKPQPLPRQDAEIINL